MSSYLYGARTRARLESPAELSYPAVTAQGLKDQRDVSGPPVADTTSPVENAEDVLLALVPAEVLALHAVYVAGRDSVDGVRRWTAGQENIGVLLALLVIAGALCVWGERKADDPWGTAARAIITMWAVVVWLHLQPASVLDAVALTGLSDGLVNGIVAVLTVAAAIVAGLLSKAADRLQLPKG